MNCMYCGSKLIDGKISFYKFGNIVPIFYPATIKFKARDDKYHKHKSYTHIPNSHAYYCKKCKRIIADFDVVY